jgi:outer membrane protein
MIVMLFPLATIIGTIFSGCGDIKRYTYSSIQAEYADSALSYQSDTDKFQNNLNQKVSDIPSIYFPEKSLSLEKILIIAFENNPDLNMAHYRIQQASAMIDLSNAAFWPAIGIYTEYMQGDAPSSYLFKSIDQRKLPPDVNFNDPGWFENYETGLNANMNLFNGGKDYLAVQTAKKNETIAQLDRHALENLLIAEIIKNFYDTQAALEFIEIAKESVKTVSEQLRIMRVRFEQGGALKADVLSLEVRLAETKEQLLSSENRYHLTLTRLSNLMGLDPSFLNEWDGIFEKSFPFSPSIPDSYTDAVIHALENRPELARVRQQLIQSRIELDSAKTGYLPRLDLMARYYLADPNMQYNTDRENWVAALLLNWEFFTGFSTPATVQKAKAMVKEMLEADRNAVLGIRLEVKTAYLKLEEARSRYQVAVNTLNSAEESLRLVENYYQGGSVPVTRFLEAELDLNHARIRTAAAYYDQIKAKSEIARALGLWSFQIILPNQHHHEDK